MTNHGTRAPAGASERPTCDFVLLEAGPICSVRCARPVGHAGDHACQWNEDDERRAASTAPDPIAAIMLEVRQNIDVLRRLHPGCDDKTLALVLFRKAETYGEGSRVAHLLGLVATVLHFAAKHGAT